MKSLAVLVLVFFAGCAHGGGRATDSQPSPAPPTPPTGPCKDLWRAGEPGQVLAHFEYNTDQPGTHVPLDTFALYHLEWHGSSVTQTDAGENLDARGCGNVLLPHIGKYAIFVEHHPAGTCNWSGVTDDVYYDANHTGAFEVEGTLNLSCR